MMRKVSAEVDLNQILILDELAKLLGGKIKWRTMLDFKTLNKILT